MKCNIIVKFALGLYLKMMISSADRKILELDALIASSSCVSVVVHSHPDGDAIGSGIGLCHYLKEKRGCDCRLLVPDAFSETLVFLPLDGFVIDASSDAAQAERRIKESGLIFCLDMNHFNRAGVLENALAASDARKVLIDHHPDPDRDSFDVVFSETEISSASELLYWVLTAMSGEGADASVLPEATRRSLMTGMTTDTNNFANSVFPTTLAMASSLLGAGVDRDSILLHIYSCYRENRLRAMGFFLDRLMKITPDGVAYMIVTRETAERFDLHEGETEGFVNLPLSIEKVKMSLFLKEDASGEFFRVSVRSKKGWSANGLAGGYFNGGGHECAAGGKLFFPSDIPDREAAADYIEKVTARFLHREGPAI